MSTGDQLYATIAGGALSLGLVALWAVCRDIAARRTIRRWTDTGPDDADIHGGAS